MSIHVTVSGNPVSIKRGKMLLADKNVWKKNEFDRRRKVRLEQVREQSKDLASKLRQDVRKEREKQVSDFEKEQTAELKKWQAMKLLSLQQKYQECLEEVGAGHTQAALVPDPAVVIAEQRKRNLADAQRRGREATEKARKQNEELSQQKNTASEQKKLARSVEDVRSAMVSSINETTGRSKSPLRERPGNKPGNGRHETQVKTFHPYKSPKSKKKDRLRETSDNRPYETKVKTYHPYKKTSPPEKRNLNGTSRDSDNDKSSAVTNSRGSFDDQASDESRRVSDPPATYRLPRSSGKDDSSSSDQTMRPTHPLSENQDYRPLSDIADNVSSRQPVAKVTKLNRDAEGQPSGASRPQLADRSTTMHTSESSSSGSGIARIPNTPASSSSKQAVAPPRVQYYDHDSRYHREYEPHTVVEKITARPEPVPSDEEDPGGAVVPPQQDRVAQAQRRGQEAMARERVQRDYVRLMGDLNVLAREDRVTRSLVRPGIPADIHLNEDRRRRQLSVRQRDMDTAFEGVLHASRLVNADGTASRPAGVVSTSRSEHAWQGDDVTLNVGHFSRTTLVPADPSSPASSDGTVVIGTVPRGPARLYDTRDEAQASLERLMERVNAQRRLLLDEVGHLNVIGSNIASLPGSKRPADKDLSFTSSSSESSLAPCETKVKEVWLPPVIEERKRAEGEGKKNSASKKPKPKGDDARGVTTVVSELSLDMSVSRTEHSLTSLNGRDGSSTSYEGLKIMVSMVEKRSTSPKRRVVITDHTRAARGGRRKVQPGEEQPLVDVEIRDGEKGKSRSKSPPDSPKKPPDSPGKPPDSKPKSPRRSKDEGTRKPMETTVKVIGYDRSKSPPKHSDKIPKKQEEVREKNDTPPISPTKSAGEKSPVKPAMGKSNVDGRIETPARPGDKAAARGRPQTRNKSTSISDVSRGTGASESTAYNSPPDAVAAGCANTVTVLLRSIAAQQQKLDAWQASLRYLNEPSPSPSLQAYIDRLLVTSRGALDDMSSVSEVSTPSSSVVNHPLNRRQDLDSLLQARVEQISRELSDLEGGRSDLALTRALAARVQQRARERATARGGATTSDRDATPDSRSGRNTTQDGSVTDKGNAICAERTCKATRKDKATSPHCQASPLHLLTPAVVTKPTNQKKLVTAPREDKGTSPHCQGSPLHLLTPAVVTKPNKQKNLVTVPKEDKGTVPLWQGSPLHLLTPAGVSKPTNQKYLVTHPNGPAGPTSKDADPYRRTPSNDRQMDSLDAYEGGDEATEREKLITARITNLSEMIDQVRQEREQILAGGSGSSSGGPSTDKQSDEASTKTGRGRTITRNKGTITSPGVSHRSSTSPDTSASTGPLELSKPSKGPLSDVGKSQDTTSVTGHGVSPNRAGKITLNKGIVTSPDTSTSTGPLEGSEVIEGPLYDPGPSQDTSHGVGRGVSPNRAGKITRNKGIVTSPGISRRTSTSRDTSPSTGPLEGSEGSEGPLYDPGPSQDTSHGVGRGVSPNRAGKITRNKGIVTSPGISRRTSTSPDTRPSIRPLEGSDVGEGPLYDPGPSQDTSHGAGRGVSPNRAGKITRNKGIVTSPGISRRTSTSPDTRPSIRPLEGSDVGEGPLYDPGPSQDTSHGMGRVVSPNRAGKITRNKGIVTSPGISRRTSTSPSGPSEGPLDDASRRRGNSPGAGRRVSPSGGENRTRVDFSPRNRRRTSTSPRISVMTSTSPGTTHRDANNNGNASSDLDSTRYKSPPSSVQAPQQIAPGASLAPTNLRGTRFAKEGEEFDLSLTISVKKDKGKSGSKSPDRRCSVQRDTSPRSSQRRESPPKSPQRRDSPPKSPQQRDGSSRAPQQRDSPPKSPQQFDGSSRAPQQRDSSAKSSQRRDSPPKTSQRRDSSPKSPQRSSSPSKSSQQPRRPITPADRPGVLGSSTTPDDEALRTLLNRIAFVGGPDVDEIWRRCGTRQELSTIVEVDTPSRTAQLVDDLFTAPVAHWLDSDKSSVSSVEGESPEEELQAVFKRLGFNWASTTLRKTQAAKDLSSSSSPDNGGTARSRRAGVRRTSEERRDESSGKSNELRAPGLNRSLPKNVRDHSTPMKISSVSNGSSGNPGTSTQRASFAFPNESDVSTVHQTSSGEKNVTSPGGGSSGQRHSSDDKSKET